ncbi:uncharacterized protein G2W53_024426 [Senna tora]|uniref:Uncharacterized protein n=1 Tax=Senna tora TaxID=362788 RepID=A0A834TD52_9FABA|nr:uncharacterized protein G2W53_024426 [Senna tora]
MPEIGDVHFNKAAKSIIPTPHEI